MQAARIFELQGAGIQHGKVRALCGIDLTVGQGERVAVIGPSGAGKTSLIGLMNGTLMPTAGRVRVLGRDLVASSPRELRDVQRKLGTIHQQFDLVKELRAVHNVNAGRLGSWPLWKAMLSLLLPREVNGTRQAMERVGIGGKLYARTEDLSGGEQQRVAIARVLVQQPAAILADEPVASLDPARGRVIMDLLHDITAETGATLLASLHDVQLALDRFERVIGLRDGTLVFDTEPARLAQADIDALYALTHKREPT